MVKSITFSPCIRQLWHWFTTLLILQPKAVFSGNRSIIYPVIIQNLFFCGLNCRFRLLVRCHPLTVSCIELDQIGVCLPDCIYRGIFIKFCLCRYPAILCILVCIRRSIPSDKCITGCFRLNQASTMTVWNIFICKILYISHAIIDTYRSCDFCISSGKFCICRFSISLIYGKGHSSYTLLHGFNMQRNHIVRIGSCLRFIIFCQLFRYNTLHINGCICKSIYVRCILQFCNTERICIVVKQIHTICCQNFIAICQRYFFNWLISSTIVGSLPVFITRKLIIAIVTTAALIHNNLECHCCLFPFCIQCYIIGIGCIQTRNRISCTVRLVIPAFEIVSGTFSIHQFYTSARAYFIIFSICIRNGLCIFLW